MKNRIRESVTPSGVSFKVRALKGKDQETLTTVDQDNSSTSSIDKVLANCLISIGNKGDAEITPKVVGGLLSNDRKFILVTLRQHTLNYKELFEFKYEWPIDSGKKDKDVQEFSVNFTSDNFPIKPYWWIKEKIEETLKDDPDIDIPDGHKVLYPVMFENYSDMIEEHQEVEGEFESGTLYKWKLLDGQMEKNMVASKKINVNTPIKMRNVKYLFGDAPDVEQGGDAKKQVWTIFNVSDADILDLEQLRAEIGDKEGMVDTGLTIQHQTNPLKQVKIDLISTPAFFFPSLGR